MQKITLPLIAAGIVVGIFSIYLYPSREIVQVNQTVEAATSSASTTSTAIVEEEPTLTPAPAPKPKEESVPVGEVGGREFKAYVTGYSYFDNTPPGSPEISNGVLHKTAGGEGTWSDPITVAVGHSIIGKKDILDYPEGTKFYFPHLRKYGIVEDTCGDGSKPQNGPCHTGYQGYPWLDIYVGGKDVSRSTSEDCMDDITDIVIVIEDPGSNYPVKDPGSLSESGCEVF